ncbi:MAG: LysR family transcriptional regulator [Elusimicrobia bacterium]|nr:LysR family transcriptional regulator [Elusimicrobiota bacterium]
MNIETLKVFRDLADSESFSKAAELNYISQSAVSQQIKKLEIVLKCKLFNRSGGRISLTVCGEKFYDASKKIVLLYENAVTSIKQSRSIKNYDEIRISTIYSVGTYLLQKYLEKFMQRYPLVKISVEYRQYQQVYADIISGRANLGIVAYPQKKHKNMLYIPMCKEKMVLISGMKNPIAKHDTVRINQLNGLDFIFFDKHIPSREYLDDVFKKHGIKINVKMELDDLETIKTVVQTGDGVSIVPYSSIREGEKGNRFHVAHLSDAEVSRPLYILVKKDKKLSQIVNILINILTEKISSEKT